MSLSYAFPGGASPNTYIPTLLDAQNSLQVEFSRNPKKFKFLQYCNIIPVTKSIGKYVRIDPTMAVRIIGTNSEEFAWADNDPAPALRRGGGEDDNVPFEFPQYSATRYAPYFGLGNMAIEQAQFDVVATNARAAATKCATIRAKKVYNVLSSSANFGTSVTATAAGGGHWDQATNTALYIKLSIQYGSQLIVLATGGCVQHDDLVLVVSVPDAFAMAATTEIQGILQQSPFALASLTGEPTVNAAYGLPPHLYGVRVIVDDTVVVTSKPNGTLVENFLLPQGTALLMARPGNPGGLMELPTDANEAPTFGALSIFSLEDMALQIEDDHPLSRRKIGQCVENSDVRMTAPVSAVQFTAVHS